MSIYKINSADFATQEGDFDLIGVLDGVIYLESANKLKKPFVSVTTSEIPLEIANAISERENSITAARTAKTAEIDEARNAYIAGGVEYKGVVYDADERAQQLLSSMIALYSASGQAPESIQWIAKANSVETLSFADLVALGAALAKRVSDSYLKARELKNKVTNSTNLAEISAVVWSD